MLSFVVFDEFGCIRLLTSELEIACFVAQSLEEKGLHPRIELMA